MENISNKLDNINCTLEKMVKVMDKSEHPFLKVLKIVMMIASIFGIVSVINIIMTWL